MHAVYAIYEGHVQGVGFRVTVRRAAAGFEVTGWVRNLPDGRVELFAQSADKAELEGFLDDVRDGEMSGNIRKVERAVTQPDRSCLGFSIK
jgi:acylphosphatase